MKRREFSAGVTAATAATAALGGLGLLQPAHAQGAVEGTHYIKLAQPLTTGGDGKIEVIEFFWYGCPHCNEFEPLLEAWVKKLPADIAFRRVPVAFRPQPFEIHQKLYYGLEALGQVPALHRKVFYAIHNEGQRLDKLPDIAAWLSKQGVDGAKFTEAANSFGVAGKMRQARQLSESYRIDGVPALGIHGRFYTSAPLAGNHERALAVADQLIAQVRKAR
jgi:protein dithiol oxidoreductase (disulfide-forming)